MSRSPTNPQATAGAVAISPRKPGIGGIPKLGSAGWLSLAAAPTFIAMAVIMAFAESPHILCSSEQIPSPLTGMTMMYLLMGTFHLAPWLRLARGAGLQG